MSVRLELPCERLLRAGVDFTALSVEAEQEAAVTGGTFTVDRGPGRTPELRDHDADMKEAERACASCPILARCHDLATSTDVAGFAAGLPESARPRHNTPAPIVDPVHAVGLVRDALTDAPRLVGKSRVPQVLAEAVRAWRTAGWERTDMLAALAGVTLADGMPVTKSTLEAALVAPTRIEQGALFDA